MAPELFEDDFDLTYTPATDIFAYAIVLWELAAREIPYSKVSNDRVEQLIQKGKRAKIDPSWPAILQTLLPLCWHQDPKQRPSAERVIELFEQASPPEPINPALRDAYLDSLIKPLYEDFLNNVEKLMHVHHSIFISYAWPPKEGGHSDEKDLQLFLARLYDDFTIYLKLPLVWDLKSLNLGHDIEDFMRRGVLDSYRVLMIGTPTYATRAADPSTNVHKEITHMARKRSIEKDSIIPLLYCGEWATSFPRGYKQVLAVTTLCYRYINFYKSLPNILISLLGLLPEDTAQYNQYKDTFLANIERLIAGVTDEQVRAFNKESFRSSTQERQQFLTRRCETVRHDYPTYQGEIEVSTLRPKEESTEPKPEIKVEPKSLEKQAQPVVIPPVEKSSGAAAAAASPARSQTQAGAATFFAPAAKLAVDQVAVEKLLLHVARGEQDEAETMLKVKGNESLLLHKGKVTDYSNRTFNNITAFQYALWALDWHMWKMLRKYLDLADPSAAARQLQDLESNGPGPGNADHGKQYDFTPLIKALKTYVDQFDALCTANKYDALTNLWITGIGGAQCQVPAHVANEYCRPDRPFDPKPSFTEATLPRTFDIYKDNKFFPLAKYSWGSLSSHFSIYRGRAVQAAAWPEGRARCMLVLTMRAASGDLVAITGLCEVRTRQYQDLKLELTAQLAARPRP